MLDASQTRSENEAALTREACLAEVDRVVQSPFLSSSDALCKLLKFLARHTLNSPTEHIKEYEIATAVFGRPSDFDPQADSGVRVQMGRLRSKLAEYYQTVGTGDPIQIDVPKGGYSLSFRQRAESNLEPSETDALNASGKPGKAGVRWTLAIAVAALVCALAAVSFLIYFHRLPASPGQSNNQAAQAVPIELRTFWGPFFESSEAPFVVFSNAQFVGSPVSGMRYYDPSKDSREQVSQHYTGIGEVMGVEELKGLFLRMGRQFQVKRSGLFTLDDARKNNLIFVGSPTENLTLGQIPLHSGFVFKRLQAGQGDWTQKVVDLEPRAGESNEYLPTPESRPLESDYAVITLTHGLDRTRWILILAGASTVGTQAAVDYACDSESVKDLLHRLNIQRGADVKPFEALLRIRVANDVPLTTELVKVRATK